MLSIILDPKTQISPTTMKLFSSVLIALCAPALGMPGGWSTISADDENVVAAAHVNILPTHCSK
jgi:hypothetical protein